MSRQGTQGSSFCAGYVSKKVLRYIYACTPYSSRDTCLPDLPICPPSNVVTHSSKLHAPRSLSRVGRQELRWREGDPQTSKVGNTHSTRSSSSVPSVTARDDSTLAAGKHPVRLSVIQSANNPSSCANTVGWRSTTSTGCLSTPLCRQRQLQKEWAVPSCRLSHNHNTSQHTPPRRICFTLPCCNPHARYPSCNGPASEGSQGAIPSNLLYIVHGIVSYSIDTTPQYCHLVQSTKVHGASMRYDRLRITPES